MAIFSANPFPIAPASIPSQEKSPPSQQRLLALLLSRRDGTCYEHREYVLRPLIQRAAMAWLRAISCISIPTSVDLAPIEEQVTGDPESLDLVKALHRIHTKKKELHRATSLLRKHREKLAIEGMLQYEVETLLEEIWC